MQPEDVFAGHLAARAVFEKVRSILEGLGPVEVRTSKSQVAFIADEALRVCGCRARNLSAPTVEVD